MFKSEPTIRFDIYMAGDIDQAKQVCREMCMGGLCVHIEPVDYIYTGGQEAGFKVGLINYPRFPSDSKTLKQMAISLATELRKRLCQHSFTIVGLDETLWDTTRETT